MQYTYCDSPVGPLLLAGDNDGLNLVSFPAGKKRREPAPDWQSDSSLFNAAIEQFNAYFAGELTQFDLRLSPRGTTFQRRVWRALRDIPYGRTISYGQLAENIGKPKASRAVGAANGNNPLSIIVPCHRVIGANGSLTGFGGGLDTKRWLLEHERAIPRSSRQQSLFDFKEG